MGILKTGASYVAVEADYPEERIKYILENSQSQLLLSGNESDEVFEYDDREIEEIAYSPTDVAYTRSEEHTSELQSRQYLVCRLLLEQKRPCSVVSVSRHCIQHN